MDANTKAMQEDLKKMGDNQAKAEMLRSNTSFLGASVIKFFRLSGVILQ
jgi:hypothetical protein